MVAREQAPEGHAETRTASITSRVFATWRLLLTRASRSSIGARIAVHDHAHEEGPDESLRASVISGIRSGAFTRTAAWVMVAAGLTAFLLGVAISAALSSQSDRTWAIVAQSSVWLTWLLGRLVVLRLITGVRTKESLYALLGAWAAGLLPFVGAISYPATILAGWAVSPLVTWKVLSLGPVGSDRARRAVLAYIAIEVTILALVALARNMAVVAILLGG